MTGFAGALRALAVAVALAGCATAAGPAPARSSGGVAVGQTIPDLTLRDLGGKTINLRALRGQVILLDIWASWCEPCKQEMPLLDRLAARYRDRGVAVLAVSIDEERTNVDRFLATRGRWALTVAHDSSKAVGDTFQPEKMPTSYVIDREGIVRYVNAGFVPADGDRIEAQLAELAR